MQEAKSPGRPEPQLGIAAKVSTPCLRHFLSETVHAAHPQVKQLEERLKEAQADAKAEARRHACVRIVLHPTSSLRFEHIRSAHVSILGEHTQAHITDFPTEAPTPAPTKTPTEYPTHSPTEAPSTALIQVLPAESDNVAIDRATTMIWSIGAWRLGQCRGYAATRATTRGDANRDASPRSSNVRCTGDQLRCCRCHTGLPLPDWGIRCPELQVERKLDKLSMHFDSRSDAPYK